MDLVYLALGVAFWVLLVAMANGCEALGRHAK